MPALASHVFVASLLHCAAGQIGSTFCGTGTVWSEESGLCVVDPGYRQVSGRHAVHDGIGMAVGVLTICIALLAAAYLYKVSFTSLNHLSFCEYMFRFLLNPAHWVRVMFRSTSEEKERLRQNDARLQPPPPPPRV